jgi:hypothetical protein
MFEIRRLGLLALAATVLAISGCGLIYQAGSHYRAHKMSEELKAGQTMSELHQKWGEPDLRAYPDQHTEIWSYAVHANSNDVAATLLYTSAKEGDAGTFLDLKLVDGKLVSWNEAKHTMPAKESSGFRAGMGTGGSSAGAVRY